jgi:hypothetical protein
MSDIVQINSQVGGDGVLNVRVDLGHTEANKQVVVTIQPVQTEAGTERLSWPEFINRTYGSLAGLDVERHEQGFLEQREPVA